LPARLEDRVREFAPVVRADVVLLRVDAEREPLRVEAPRVKLPRVELPRVELRRARDVPVLRDRVLREPDDVVRARVPAPRVVPARVLRLRVPPERVRDDAVRFAPPERDEVLPERVRDAVVRFAPPARDEALPERVRDDVVRFAPPEREDAVPERVRELVVRELVVRERVPAVLGVPVERVRVPEVLRVEVPERPLARRLLFVVAFSRPTSLLKLLCSPPAVSSCTSSARLLSSNFSNQSSQSMRCSESAPLYPGKSRRIMPVSPPPPVPRTHAGCALRSSAHWRISS
jgi:hypothetical protein